MVPSRRVLIINFKFPPNNGIGGRRWAKFAKGLLQSGFTIDVIAAEPLRRNNISPWFEDVNSQNINIYFLKQKFARFLNPKKKKYFASILYRLAFWALKRREQGAKLDLAIGYQASLSEQIFKLVQENRPLAICVTGAPFNFLYYVALLRNHLNDIRMIADFRDAWIGSPYYGMPDLSHSQKTIELNKHQLVLDSFDFLTVPYLDMIEDIKQYDLNGNSLKFVQIAHSFDPDDFLHIDAQTQNRDKKIRWVYGGALANELSPALIKFSKYLDQLKKDHPKIYLDLEIKFFTAHTHRSKLFSSHRSVVQFMKPIGKNIFDEITGADGCLIFLADQYKNCLTTKIIEFLPFRKPYVYFGPPGNVLQFIEGNRLGSGIHNFSDFERLLFDPTEFNLDFDYSSYSLAAQTERLTQVLEGINPDRERQSGLPSL